ncbi:MAG: ester cyclase [Bacteroidota bacterium]
MKYFFPTAYGQKVARLRRLVLWLPMVMTLLPGAVLGQGGGPQAPEMPNGVEQGQRVDREQANDDTMEELKIDLDALSKPNWTVQERDNAALITEFMQHLMNDHDFEWVRKRHGNDNYVQHNRSLSEGIAGVVESIEGLTKRFPEYSYNVKNIYVDGDYVIFHSHVTMKKKDRGNEKKGLIIKDIWRVENGQIVEHWDALQPLDMSMRLFTLLNGGKIRNANGIF